MIVIIDTIDGVTYYFFNGILCSITIKECNEMTKFQLYNIIEKEHTGSSMCGEDQENKLKLSHPKLFKL